MTLGDLHLKAYASSEWTHVIGMDIGFLCKLKTQMMHKNISEEALLAALDSLDRSED